MRIFFSMDLSPLVNCRLLKKTQRQGARQIDERRRTLQYVERGDSSATKHMSFFSSLP